MTRALILAAGQGSRLRPLTDDRPKCLVPLLGRTLLERQVETLQSAGVTDIHIAVGYRRDQIETLGFSTSINPRFAETNMVETLFSAMEFLQEPGDLIISYGDIVYQSENLQVLLDCDADIALMIDSGWRDLWNRRLENPLDDAETLKVSEAGWITEIGKKPESYDQIEGQYTGLIKIHADRLAAFVGFYQQLDRKALYDGHPFQQMYMTSLLQLLIDSGWKVGAALVCHGWLEVDSVDDLKSYEAMAATGELERYYRAGA